MVKPSDNTPLLMLTNIFNAIKRHTLKLNKTKSTHSGYAYERRARRYLASRGLTYICANYRAKAGEIDLIMADGECLVFVEVRFRKTSDFGSAAASIGHTKQQKLTRTASQYLQQHPSWAYSRFDVVAMDGNGGDETIAWIKNAL